MTTQPEPFDPDRSLANSGSESYSSDQIERMFDLNESEQADGPQTPTGFTPRLLTTTSGDGANPRPSREDVLAVKTAQLVAVCLADATHAAIAASDTPFEPRSFVRHIARSVAAALAPALQPLSIHRRKEIVAIAVDPADTHEDLDLVLDGVGRVLDIYCDYIPNMLWTAEPTGPDSDGHADGRVITWRRASGDVLVDLIDTFGPDTTPEQHHRAEVDDISDVAAERHGWRFAAVRYFPTYAMKQARYYWPEGDSDPLPVPPVPPVLYLIKGTRTDGNGDMSCR